DDVLNVVPLDALPASDEWSAPGRWDRLDARAVDSANARASSSAPAKSDVRRSEQSDALIGDCVRIELRASLLELLDDEHELGNEPALLVLGGADFGATPENAARSTDSTSSSRLATAQSELHAAM